jgi:CCR4-NOT transcriptional complex subunit CAF120
MSYDDHSHDGQQRPSLEAGVGSATAQPNDPRGPPLVGQASSQTEPGGFAANAPGSREVMNLQRPGPSAGPVQPVMADPRSRSPLRPAYRTPETMSAPSSRPATSSTTPESANIAPSVRASPYSANPPPAAHQAAVGYRGVAPVPTPPASQGFQPRTASLTSRSTPPPDRQLPNLRTAGSVNRKPLPQRTTSLQRQETNEPSPTPSSSGSFTRTFDESVLAQVHPPADGRRSPAVSGRNIVRQDTQRSQASSNYDEEVSSTASPDYASTMRDSFDTRESVERPRAGVLKTVGDPSAPVSGTRPAPANNGSNSNSGGGLLDIDFGRTVNYGLPLSAQKPKTLAPPTNLQGAAPGVGRPVSPAIASHVRQDSDDTIRRNRAWQPGSVQVNPASSSGSAMSPQQFVQQRATQSSTPLYAHQRQPSGNTLGGATPSPPPMKRTGSHDYLSQTRRHSRQSSSELLQQGRPVSQQGHYYSGGQGDLTAQLSAREQEQVARATGSPLIVGAQNNHGPPPGNAGLVGAIDARERERAQARQGYGNPAMQQAINQRQAQQAAQMAYAQQQQLPPNISQGFPGHMYGSQEMGGMGMGSQVPPAHGSPAPGSGGRPVYSPVPGQGPPQPVRMQGMPQQQLPPAWGYSQNWTGRGQGPGGSQYIQENGDYGRGGPMAFRPGLQPQQPQPGQEGLPLPAQGQYPPGQPARQQGRGQGTQYPGHAF